MEVLQATLASFVAELQKMAQSQFVCFAGGWLDLLL